MSKEINIHVKVPGAEEAKKHLEDLSKGGKKVGRSTAAGSKSAAENVNKLNSSVAKSNTLFGRLKDSLGGWIGKLFAAAIAIRGVTTALRLQNDELEKNGTLALEQQNKLMRLQTLNALFKEKPNLRQEVRQLSEYGARPIVFGTNFPKSTHQSIFQKTFKKTQNVKMGNLRHAYFYA